MFSVIEKDFMGIAGKELSMKEEVRGGSCNDSVFLSSSVVHDKFPNKISNLQQFMSFKQEQDANHKKNVYNQFSSSGFQPLAPMGSFDTANRHFSVIPQKNLGFDGQGTHPFPMPVLSSPGANSFSKVMHRSGINTSGDANVFPVLMTQANNFRPGYGSGCLTNLSSVSPKKQQLQPFKGMSKVLAPVSGNTNSTFATRTSTMCVPATAQLTIFYGGVVNVYDGVPIEKAQEIMLIASSSSKMNSDAANPKELKPTSKTMEVKNMNRNNIQPFRKAVEVEPVKIRRIGSQANAASPRWCFPNPVTVMSQSAAHSEYSSSSSDDTRRQKSNTTIPPSVPKQHNETLKSVSPVEDESSSCSTPMPRAIPMARKASLARFLEKRKERVCSAAPYSTQKPVECSIGVVDMQTFPGKKPMGTTPEISSLPGNGKDSWCLETTKHTINNKPPNTKLEI